MSMKRNPDDGRGRCEGSGSASGDDKRRRRAGSGFSRLVSAE